jgi:hypothetical protein
MLISHHQTAGQDHNIKMDNRSFENVAKLKYLRMTVTNKNLIHNDIKSRPNSGNAFYHPAQNLLSFHLLPKNITIKIYKTVILAVVLYGCKTWSLT